MKIFLSLFLSIISSLYFAQKYSELNKSDTITIKSQIFQTERKIILTKSINIKTEAKDNNCILYMDADDPNINGIMLQSVNNLIGNKEIPQGYFVGIMHEDRNNELVEKEKLYKFITEEVIPFLEKQYNISIKVTIAGHSFGAYFATFAFLRNNALFNSCIAISPAYWPNKKDVLLLMDEKINSVSGNFYLAIGDRRWDEISIRDYTIDVQKLLKTSKNIRFSFTDLVGFSHNATPTIGFGLGLNFIYDEWEWENILYEQEKRLKNDPNFWAFLEIKADALCHLKRISEAKNTYKEAMSKIHNDKYLTGKKKAENTKRLKNKYKNCR